MNDSILIKLRDIIQEDFGKRGLRADPGRNLVNACPGDFAAACRSLAEHPQPVLGVVTGFFIPTATPPAGETDGPLGALFLARALTPLGIRAALITDDFCMRALEAGLAECGLHTEVPLVALPTPANAKGMTDDAYRNYVFDSIGRMPTHLLAIERVGPNYEGRCHTMRGRDITELMSPAHRLFAPRFSEPEASAKDGAVFAYASGSEAVVTIGIGDGGNEIGMGKISPDVIECNINNGDVIACRIATDHLIVCGVSNWGAYALAAGVLWLRQQSEPEASAKSCKGIFAYASGSDVLDPARERQLLDVMVRAGPLVDGVTGQPTATVDGLTWEQYAKVLSKIGGAISEPEA